MSTEKYLQILERRAQAWAARVADLEDRLDRHTRVLSDKVPGMVVERDALWCHLRERLDEARDEYIRHRTTALDMRQRRP